MLKPVSLAVALAAMSSLGANLLLNSPTQWGTHRTKEIPVQFIADSTLYGKAVTVSLYKKENGKERVVEKKKITLSQNGNNTTFKRRLQDLGGRDFYKLKWKCEDTTANGEMAPFSIKPLKNNGLTMVDTVTHSLQDSKKISVGSSIVNFKWNNENLTITVKGDKKVSVLLDPANMKGGFLTYSNRMVTVEGKEVSYHYFDRVYEKESEKTRKGSQVVNYYRKDWKGNMSSVESNGLTTVTIPWHTLGLKMSAKRIVGTMVMGENKSYPKGSDRYEPATWGNFYLK